ncbi:MAG TPA: hypothetical protein VNF07_05415 [Acidimicrobiales bacterium]|nr:hypothetical protein [Acidimicrobiales bacterium]
MLTTGGPVAVDGATAADEGARARSRWGDAALLGVVFAVGVVPVVLVLALRGGLYGITEYDDGVYFAAALRLVAGLLPYRHFVFVEPPGITVLLAPFALLAHLTGGRDALAAARLFTALVAGANALLVATLLRRHGRLAMAVGGLALAVFPTGYAADHTFLLEPFCVLFCLIGVRLVFTDEGRFASSRRCALGGASVAFACDVKTFAVVVLVVLAVVLVCSAPRRAAAFALGAALAVAVTVLPFFLAAPHAFLHEVVVSQLTRGTARPTPLLNRLFALVGLAYAAPSLAVAPNLPSLPRGLAPTLAAALVLGAVLLLLVLRLLGRRDRSPWSWFVVLSALATAATALGPPAYYAHYAAFPAPFLAIALGTGVALLPRPAGRRRLLAGGLAGLVVGAGSLVVLVISGGYHDTIASKFGDWGPVVAARVPAGACVVADSESVLVSAGRAFPAGDGCPQLLDATGIWLAADPANPPHRLFQPFASHLQGGKDPALVALWAEAFRRADYVVVSGCTAFRIPWTTALLSEFEERYERLPTPIGAIYGRRPKPLRSLPAGGLPTPAGCLLP